MTPEKSPIFIMGCPHSGTSLLLAIMDSHHNIVGIPYESSLYKANASRTKQLLQDFNSRVLKDPNANRWVEKTPMNLLKIHDMHSKFINAKFIIIIRDGRDVATSIKKRTGNLEQGVDYWLQYTSIGNSAASLDRVYTIFYENLITNMSNELMALCEFLNEKFDVDMMTYYKHERKYYADIIKKPENAFGGNHKYHRTWQINQPIFDGTKSWKTLTTDERHFVHNRLCDRLKYYGYIDDDKWICE